MALSQNIRFCAAKVAAATGSWKMSRALLPLVVARCALCKPIVSTSHLLYNVSRMETIFTVVSSKGQIVIPAALREELGIEAGTRVAIQREDNHLVIQPLTEGFISSLRGCCKGKDSLVAAREREHRIEKDRLAR